MSSDSNFGLVPAVREPESRLSRPIVSTAPDRGDAQQHSPFETLGHSLRRQWMIAAVLAVLCSVPLAAGAWLLQRPVYTSAAYLRVAASELPLVFETADKSGRYDFKTFKNTQRQLIQTPYVLSNALQRDSLASNPLLSKQPNPIEWLQKNVVVDFPGDAEIMRVSVTCGEGAAAKKIVDAVVDAYMEEVIVAAQDERVRRLDNLERVYSEAESKARSKRSELRNLADTLGSSDSDSLSLAQQGAVQQFGLVRNELTKTRFELMRAEGELRYRDKSQDLPNEESPAQAESVDKTVSEGDGEEGAADADTEPDLEFEEFLAGDRVASTILQELSQINDHIAQANEHLTATAAAEFAKKHSSRLEVLSRDLENRRAHLKQLVAQRRQRGGMPVAGNDDLVDLKLKTAVLKQQEKELSEEVVKLEDEAKKFGRSSVDVEMMRSEIDGLDAVVQQVGAEIERTKIELRGNSRISVLSKAEPGIVADKKKPLMITAMLGLVGLVAPGAFLVWRDSSKRHINSTASVSNDIGLSVLGSIPRLSRRANQHLLHRSDTEFDEGFRDPVDSIAAMLTRQAQLNDQRLILITSATAGEGKSSLACNLATSLASAGNKTILVDFDFRRPSLHRLFGLPIAAGIGDVLLGVADVKDVIHQLDSGLHVATAGSTKNQLWHLASGSQLRTLLASLREEYEFVIVDAGPLLPMADAKILAQHTDGVVLSVMRDVSQVSKVACAYGILLDLGVPVIGTVVAGCKDESYYSRLASNAF